MSDARRKTVKSVLRARDASKARMFAKAAKMVAASATSAKASRAVKSFIANSFLRPSRYQAGRL
jgi:hypothetical protein